MKLRKDCKFCFFIRIALKVKVSLVKPKAEQWQKGLKERIFILIFDLCFVMYAVYYFKNGFPCLPNPNIGTFNSSVYKPCLFVQRVFTPDQVWIADGQRRLPLSDHFGVTAVVGPCWRQTLRPGKTRIPYRGHYGNARPRRH